MVHAGIAQIKGPGVRPDKPEGLLPKEILVGEDPASRR